MTKKLVKENKVVTLVRNTLEYITKNFTSDINLDDIAESLNYNKFYLCRVFKETIGQTIQSYIFGLRISHAKMLLKQNKLTLTEIVYNCGFSSQAYFCYVFKKESGMTPLQFRNFSHEK